MENTSAPINNVNDYIDQFSIEIKERLEMVREVIKLNAPEAEECISYAMPAYKYFGILVYFAAFKNHIGFYAVPSGHAAFSQELSAYKGGKGSVQFPHNQELPIELIAKIVQFRVNENKEKAKKA